MTIQCLVDLRTGVQVWVCSVWQVCVGESRTQRLLDLRSELTSKQLSSHRSSLIRNSSDYCFKAPSSTDATAEAKWKRPTQLLYVYKRHISLKITVRKHRTWNNSGLMCLWAVRDGWTKKLLHLSSVWNPTCKSFPSVNFLFLNGFTHIKHQSIDTNASSS